MKTTLFSLIALGAFTVAAAVGPVDRAAAGEPMVLNDAELDRVTAGVPLPAAPTALVAGTDSGALPADRTYFNYNYFNNAVTMTEPHLDTARERIRALRHAPLIGY
jgi:hypothetical protein